MVKIDCEDDVIRSKYFKDDVKLTLLPSGHYEMELWQFPEGEIIDTEAEPTMTTAPARVRVHASTTSASQEPLGL